MSPEAQRIAIAEACGWRLIECHVGKNIPVDLLAWERGRECVRTGPALRTPAERTRNY